MKNLLSLFLIILLPLAHIPVISSADNSLDNENGIVATEVIDSYKIFDQSGALLTEKDVVELGDIIIDKNLREFEIIFIDDENFTATARFIRQIEPPKIRKNVIGSVNQTTQKNLIGLYSTHNDESYINGDNTESIYGKGGIHDIGAKLAEELAKKNVTASYNQTLHIPHNGSAYSRSRATAKALLANGNSAIFDIHRDATSRSFYLANFEGKNYSKIRIVVGQNNPNKDENLQFALWLTNVANSLYPWMIADIYYGKNTYNQDLSSKALLFEMGCHNIEKTYVLRTVPYLADVIATTLFNTTVEEETGNLNIGENNQATQPSQSPVNPTINEVLPTTNPTKKSNFLPIIFAFTTAIILIGFLLRRRTKKQGH